MEPLSINQRKNVILQNEKEKLAKIERQISEIQNAKQLIRNQYFKSNMEAQTCIKETNKFKDILNTMIIINKQKNEHILKLKKMFEQNNYSRNALPFTQLMAMRMKENMHLSELKTIEKRCKVERISQESLAFSEYRISSDLNILKKNINRVVYYILKLTNNENKINFANLVYHFKQMLADVLLGIHVNKYESQLTQKSARNRQKKENLNFKKKEVDFLEEKCAKIFINFGKLEIQNNALKSEILALPSSVSESIPQHTKTNKDWTLIVGTVQGIFERNPYTATDNLLRILLDKKFKDTSPFLESTDFINAKNMLMDFMRKKEPNYSGPKSSDLFSDTNESEAVRSFFHVEDSSLSVINFEEKNKIIKAFVNWPCFILERFIIKQFEDINWKINKISTFYNLVSFKYFENLKTSELMTSEITNNKKTSSNLLIFSNPIGKSEIDNLYKLIQNINKNLAFILDIRFRIDVFFDKINNYVKLINKVCVFTGSRHLFFTVNSSTVEISKTLNHSSQITSSQNLSQLEKKYSFKEKETFSEILKKDLEWIKNVLPFLQFPLTSMRLSITEDKNKEELIPTFHFFNVIISDFPQKLIPLTQLHRILKGEPPEDLQKHVSFLKDRQSLAELPKKQNSINSQLKKSKIKKNHFNVPSVVLKEYKLSDARTAIAERYGL